MNRELFDLLTDNFYTVTVTTDDNKRIRTNFKTKAQALKEFKRAKGNHSVVTLGKGGNFVCGWTRSMGNIGRP